jgi:hypothetical protein
MSFCVVKTAVKALLEAVIADGISEELYRFLGNLGVNRSSIQNLIRFIDGMILNMNTESGVSRDIDLSKRNKDSLVNCLQFDPKNKRGERLMEGIDFRALDSVEKLMIYLFLGHQGPKGPFYTFGGKSLVELVEKQECRVFLLMLMFTDLNKQYWPEILEFFPESMFELEYVRTTLSLLKVEYKSFYRFQNNNHI